MSDGLGPESPTIGAVNSAVYRIPTDAPEADGTLAWDATTMIMVQVAAGDTTGTGWTYGPAACDTIITDDLEPVVRDRSAMDIPGASAAMIDAVRNHPRPGAVTYAISAIDLALWDLKARLLGQPLHRMLGRCREQVSIYGSGGFTSYDAVRLERQLDDWVAGQEIPRVKIKIGESCGAAVDRDVRRIRDARRVIGDAAELFVDANGGYSAKQAIRVAHRVSDAAVTWFEEPVSSDDLAGLRLVRESVTPDVTAGEYGTDLVYFRRMCESAAVDCLQVDATRCGGISEWFRAAAVAAAHNLEVSAHCAPHVHAAAAAATPNLRHVEWFHDHVRIEARYFDGALDPTGGTISPDDSAPGHGLEPRHSDLERFRVG